MRNRYLLWSAVALLAGCSAPHYQSLAEFGQAVRDMKLVGQPLIEAHKALRSKDFDCDGQPHRIEDKPELVELRCHRKIKRGGCEQHQYVYLRHRRDGAEIAEVVSTLNGCLS